MRFSIIIPTHDRPEQLSSCLRAIGLLNHPRDQFEVIVVDDGSPQSMETIVEQYSDSFAVFCIRTANQGPGPARNTGAARARGEYLAFTDDDCRPEPTWLCRLSEALERTPNSLVGGRTVNALQGNIYSVASHVILDVVYDFNNRNWDDARFLASNNIAMPAGRYCEIGGFDTSFHIAGGEDRELCDRWIHHGGNLAYTPDAVIQHYHVLSLRSFFRQHFQYGRGAALYHRIRTVRGCSGLVGETKFYRKLPKLLRKRLLSVNKWQALVVSGLLVAWQLANTAGYLFGKLFDLPRINSSGGLAALQPFDRSSDTVDLSSV